MVRTAVSFQLHDTKLKKNVRNVFLYLTCKNTPEEVWANCQSIWQLPGDQGSLQDIGYIHILTYGPEQCLHLASAECRAALKSSSTSFILLLRWCGWAIYLFSLLSYGGCCAIIFFAYLQHLPIVTLTYSLIIKFKCRSVLGEHWIYLWS